MRISTGAIRNRRRSHANCLSICMASRLRIFGSFEVKALTSSPNASRVVGGGETVTGVDGYTVLHSWLRSPNDIGWHFNRCNRGPTQRDVLEQVCVATSEVTSYFRYLGSV